MTGGLHVDDMVSWYLTRLNEIERYATDAEGNGRWDIRATGVLELGGTDDLGLDGLITGPRDAIYHICLHDPRAVLADVAAKRRLIAVHEVVPLSDDALKPTGFRYCLDCGGRDGIVEAEDEWPCEPVRLLVSTLAHHPGYRQEWAPTERSVS